MTSTPWVLCCGEALFDVTTSDAEHLVAHIGGGPTSAALALARAGIRSALWAGRPTGVYGDRLEQELRDGGVSTDHLTPSGAPPSMSLASARGTSVAYDIFAEGTSAYDISIDELPLRKPDGGPFDLVHLGGLGTAVPPMSHVLRESAPLWSASGALIGYDPNIRDGFATRGMSLPEVEGWFRLADIVKVSTEDLDALYPGLDRAEQVSAVQLFEPRLLIVTDGPGPVVAHAGGASASAAVTPWPPGVLPVGAGDAFIAGAYSALLRDRQLLAGSEESLQEILAAGLTSVAAHAARRARP
jgi:fructokinase